MASVVYTSSAMSSSSVKKPSRYEIMTASNLSDSNPEHKQIKEDLEKLEGGYFGSGLRSGAFEKGLTASDSVYLDDFTASVKRQEIEDKAREEKFIRESLLNKASHTAKDKPLFAMPSKSHSMEESKIPLVVSKKKRKGEDGEFTTEGNSDKIGDCVDGASKCTNKKLKEEEGNGVTKNSDDKKSINVNRPSDGGVMKSAVSALAMYESDSE